MNRDPLDGVSIRAMEAAGGATRSAFESAADAAVDAAVGHAPTKDDVFARRTREAAQRRADTARRDAEGVLDRGVRLVERGRRTIGDGLDRFPEPKEMVGRGRAVVQDSPAVALLIAGAVGFGLAWLIHGQHR